jgi:hypothetical protein
MLSPELATRRHRDLAWISHVRARETHEGSPSLRLRSRTDLALISNRSQAATAPASNAIGGQTWWHHHSLRRHDPDQVRRVCARKRVLSPSTGTPRLSQANRVLHRGPLYACASETVVDHKLLSITNCCVAPRTCSVNTWTIERFARRVARTLTF